MATTAVRQGQGSSTHSVEPRNGAVQEYSAKTRVFIAAENRLLQETLARMLTKRGDIDVIVADRAGPFHAEELVPANTKIVLLASRGKLSEDLVLIRKMRSTA